MVQKIFTFFYRETPLLHKAAYLLGFFAVLSQVLAFFRDRLLAHMFGAGSALDVYYAAFRIPDFLFVTIASLVSLSVVIPFIIEKEKEGKEKVKELVNNIFAFFSLMMISCCVAAFFLMPYFSGLLFKGFTGETLDRVVFLSRILLLSPIALGFSNLFGSLTQAYNRFVIYAFAPFVYNLSIILGIVFLAPSYGITGVAISVVIGAMLHALIQIPFVLKIGLFPVVPQHLDFGSLKKIARLSFPRTLTLSTSHVASLFMVSLASLMVSGSISVFSLAFNIQSVPLSIIGVSYSLAAFPTLSRYYANKDMQAFTSSMAITARHIIFWSLPIMSLFIVIRAQIVRVLLGTGHFDWNDTRLTAAALALFAVSTVFQSLILLFVRAFYSAGYTKKPFLINLFSTGILVGCTYGLVKLFYYYPEFQYFITALLKVENVPGAAVLMLPLGYSIGTIINGILHWVDFEKDFKGFTREVGPAFYQSCAASVILGFVAYLGLSLFGQLLRPESLVEIFLQGLGAGVLGIIAGIIVLFLLKNREVKEVGKSLRARFWNTRVVSTDPEIV